MSVLTLVNVYGVMSQCFFGHEPMILCLLDHESMILCLLYMSQWVNVMSGLMSLMSMLTWVNVNIVMSQRVNVYNVMSQRLLMFIVCITIAICVFCTCFHQFQIEGKDSHLYLFLINLPSLVSLPNYLFCINCPLYCISGCGSLLMCSHRQSISYSMLYIFVLFIGAR